MKAVCCPQCGSSIKNISPRQPIAERDYCDAKIIIDDLSPTPEPFDREVAKFCAVEPEVVPRPPVQPIFIAISGVGIFMFFMFVIALFTK